MTDILISGYYGFNNIGDEAILRTVVESVRTALPDSRLTVLSNAPEERIGLGLSALRELVQRYNGRVKAAVTEGVFTLRIAL